MLKIRSSKTFGKTIHIKRAGEKADVVESGSFVAHFHKIDTERFGELCDGLRAVSNGENVSIKGIYDFRTQTLEEVLDRVEGIGSEDGDMDGDEQRRYVISDFVCAQTTFDTFFDCYQGASLGNLKKSRER